MSGHIPNHTIEPRTGFIESNAYPDAFDAVKKTMFIEALRTKGFDLTETCNSLGISKHTIYKHSKIDKAFSDAIQEAAQEYGFHLEWISMSEAMKPKSTFERLVQLRRLFPGKYAPENKGNNAQKIEITLNLEDLDRYKQRQQAIDAEIVPDGKVIDNQSNILADGVDK